MLYVQGLWTLPKNPDCENRKLEVEHGMSILEGLKSVVAVKIRKMKPDKGNLYKLGRGFYFFT